MKFVISGALCAAAIALAGSASADVLTFEGLSSGSVPASFTDGAYTVDYTPSSGGFANVGNPTGCSPACASDGTQAIYSFNTGSFTVHRTDNATFALLSLDAAQTFTTLNRSLDLLVVGLLADNTTNTANLTTAPGGADVFSSYGFGPSFSQLASFTLKGNSAYPGTEFSFDNIVTSDSAGGVPEPASWALILVGFGLAGTALRRRRIGLAA